MLGWGMVRRTLLWNIIGAAAAFAELPAPPSYICQRTEEAITVDGRADEAVWQRAARLSPLRDIEGGEAADTTQIRMLWDDRCLYVLAEMPEADLWATQRERDSVVFRDPDFEIFIDPNSESNHYIELEINALNTVWDLFIARTYRTGKAVILHDWNIPQLQHAVHLRGTLNDPRDRDEGWSVELAIPWRSITGHNTQPRTDTPPVPGSSMHFNFSRVNYAVQPDTASPCGYAKCSGADNRPLPESNHVWAPTGRINIHMPEHWGRVVFSPHPAGTWEARADDAESAIRPALYAYAEAQSDFRRRRGRFAVSAAEQRPLPPLPPHTEATVKEDFYVLRSFCPAGGRVLQLDSAGNWAAEQITLPLPRVCLWVHGGDEPNNRELWQQRFADYAAAGVDEVIIGDTEAQIRALTPLARQAGLQVTAWLWALNRPQDAEPLRHPDWFAVSRAGRSCHAEGDRPYVPYYGFLCPNNAAVRAHLLQQADTLCAIEGVRSVQLDYMRMPDVILPRGLWAKYGLETDAELPPFDFCYCDTCRRLFRERYGREPNRENPADDADWREFRLQSVADLAGALCERIRSHGKKAACAVFPTPQTAARMVRQDWARFPLDWALPMAYHSFYDEQRDWIAESTRAAAEQTQGRIPLAPGLHLPDLSPAELREELEHLRSLGVYGIGLFSHETLTPEHLRTLREWKERRPRR